MVEFNLSKMSESKQVSDYKLKKCQIEEKLRQSMEVGQTWMLVCSKWFETFKSYVGLDNNVERNNTAMPPGPIDNTLLLAEKTGTELAEGLVENLDYVAVPESAWELLRDWYGLAEYQEPIQRKVINLANPPENEPKLEVYLIKLNLFQNSEFTSYYEYAFSAMDKISDIEDICRKKFRVASDQKIVLVSFVVKQQTQHERVLSKKCNTIHEENLTEAHQIYMKFEDSWTPPAVTKNNNLLKTRVQPIRTLTNHESGETTRYRTSMPYGNLGTAEGQGCAVSPGLSGLLNLGNTCFLNSIIQCLSNCEPITKYFLDKNHEKEINVNNPLGKSGVMARAFADVISMLWSGQYAVTVPQCFKMHLTNFAPQFAGYQQHDAQELLTFLLDGLHEDLNRIQEKPYSQNEENEDEDDATLARSSWESFLRRNDSIIIDHFHGMLKSRLVCPDCEKVSIKFDTFSTLSLPLPMECERTMKVCYVPYDQSAKVVDLKVDVPKNGVINDLMMELSRVTGVRTEDMIISKVHNNHFHKFYNHDDMLREICVKEKIYMYDVPRTLAENPSVQSTILPVILCEVNDSNRSTQNKLFGTPFLLSLPPGPMLFKNFYIRICEQMTRTSEGFLKAINNVGSLPMDYESASGDSTSRSNSTTYLFKPVFVEMDSSSNVLNIDTSEDTIVQIPENYGREVLALQVERKVHKEYYNEEIPLIRDHCDTLKHSTVPTIEDCLNLFTSTEKLGTNNAWFCPRCHEKKRASKKLDLWKLPNILILHLKRFAFTEIRRGKLGIKIDYPVTGLNLSNVVANKQKENLVYDLIGVCNHYGNLTGGHYTAYCRNFNDYKWYSYDDSVVSVISPETVQTDSAYVLFYARRPIKKADPNEEKVDL
ncbi:ubiquitin carboxyl-terminal hydrolase 4-like isoform X1 [Homalodisca vitripennis]|uniref:ubiquitin carboxyl-terminal hydrolase 4-like isoform X1 n=1 Tax=Homalodisca vitripennis TaxID=197043 RepID=UPI001EEAA8C2|nr:ubiquitin carboxyl-terminal hydrolase 4-like isoform X1 [Homalodisca vitripennis]